MTEFCYFISALQKKKKAGPCKFNKSHHVFGTIYSKAGLMSV